MLDVLALFDLADASELSECVPTRPPMAPSISDDDRLRQPISVGPGDEAGFAGFGSIVDHLGRRRRCGWHLALHRGAGEAAWTHLYRVVHDRGGRVLVLLHRAAPGDCRDVMLKEVFHDAPTPNRSA